MSNSNDRSAFARGASADKDKVLERLLRRPMAERSTKPGADCVDAETLAAWSERLLPATQASAVEQHLSECARCQAMLATFARSAPVTPAPPSLWARWHLQWLVPIATAATVAGIWVAIPRDPQVPVTSEVAQESAVQQKAAADEAKLEALEAAMPKADAPAEPPAAGKDGFLRAAREGTRRNETSATGATDGAAATAKRAAEAQADALARDRNRVGALQSNERAADRSDQARLREEAAPAPPPPSSPAGTPAPAAPAARAQQKPESKLLETLTVEADSPLVEIVSQNPSMRWRVTVTGVEYSANAGKNWRPVEMKPPAEVTIGHSPSPSVLWLVGPNGAIYLTTNGSTFVQVPFIEKVDLTSVVAVNDREATVTTFDGRTFRTTDRGVTWIRTSP